MTTTALKIMRTHFIQMSNMREIFFLSCLVFLLPATAHAYIDPGSGSAIMSAIIGFFVVVGLTIKSFWYKIKSIFTGGSKDDSDTDSST